MKSTISATPFSPLPRANPEPLHPRPVHETLFLVSLPLPARRHVVRRSAFAPVRHGGLPPRPRHARDARRTWPLEGPTLIENLERPYSFPTAYWSPAVRVSPRNSAARSVATNPVIASLLSKFASAAPPSITQTSNPPALAEAPSAPISPPTTTTTPSVRNFGMPTTAPTNNRTNSSPRKRRCSKKRRTQILYPVSVHRSSRRSPISIPAFPSTTIRPSLSSENFPLCFGNF